MDENEAQQQMLDAELQRLDTHERVLKWQLRILIGFTVAGLVLAVAAFVFVWALLN